MSTTAIKQPTIALLGQPNSGKSTLFNGLTGARQRVGNWPGKTVEKKEGHYDKNGKRYHVTNPELQSFSQFRRRNHYKLYCIRSSGHH